MTGMQKALWEALMDICSGIGDGKYGVDNDVDLTEVENDLEEITTKVENEHGD